MDFLLFVIVVLLIWILYALLKSDEITNPCTDARTPESSEKAIGSIREEEEPSSDDGPDLSEEDEEQENTAGADDFLVYDTCVSEEKCDVRSAQLMSKDSRSTSVDDGNLTDENCEEVCTVDSSSAAMSEDNQRDGVSNSSVDYVVPENEHRCDTELLNHSRSGDVDPNSTKISALEDRVSDYPVRHEPNILKSSLVQMESDDSTSDLDSFNRGNKAAIICLSPSALEVGASPPKEPSGAEAESVSAEEGVTGPIRGTSDHVASSDLVDDEEDGEQLDEETNIQYLSEESVKDDVGRTELAYAPDVADATVECPALAATPISDLTIDVEVDIDVREAKVLIVPGTTSAPNAVASLTFSKCEPSISSIETDLLTSQENSESKILLPNISEMEENSSDVEDNKPVEAEMDEGKSTELEIEHNNAESIENRPSEISIVKEIGFRRQIEFTEISDEEEILYRNVTKNGTEEFTEEMSTKNEVSSVITREDIPFDQQLQTSTAITRVVSMSYTTEECSTENIEMKLVGSNLLDNPNAILFPNYQHEEKFDFNDDRETVLTKIKVDSTSTVQPEDLLESSVEDNKENLPLCPVVDQDTNTAIKKKPACGVFLFGGEELLNKIKTRRVIIDECENEGKGGEEGWRLSTTNKGLTEYKEQQTTSQTTKTSQRTHTLQHNQQTLSVTRSQKTDVAFELSSSNSEPRIAFPEEPVDVNTMTSSNTVTSSNETEAELIPAFETTESLVHINKDRVKGDLRRRRPEKAKE